MKSISIFFLSSILVLSLLSFTSPNNAKIIGTYGVDKSNPAKIKLTLNKDNTFHYTDYSNIAKAINAKGKWKEEGKYIILTDYESPYEFHTKWRVTANGKVVTSRKGWTIYTLHKID